MAGMTVIVKTISRLLFPFMFLFGIYIIVHGHLTPGGGFQGGVILAASVIMLLLAYGIERAQSKINVLQSELAESLGGLILVGLGLLGVVLGLAFLRNVLPLGELGHIFSAGNLPVLNLGVSIKVAAGLLMIFYAMLRLQGGKE
jgi:multicomponent Na+:H+ antiporter subunit B